MNEEKAPEMEQLAPASKLEDADRLALELAKQKRLTSLAQAERALVANEKSDLEYKYVVLQLYMKYKLSIADTIKEDTGEIIRGAVIPPSKE